MSAISVLLMLFSPFLSKRYSAKWQYYAWLVIIIGFIIPFRPDFNFGLINIPSSQTVQHDIQTAAGITEQGNVDLFMPAIPQKNNEKLIGSRKSNSAYENIFAVWIIGMAIMLAYNLFRHYRLVKILNRWKENITDKRTLDIVQRQKDLLGIKQNISIQKCSMITGSILAGFIKPVIFLQTTEYSDEELAFIIRHELIHLKRKDLFFKILALTAKTIHWFNPIVYLIIKAISIQCENSCDDAVISGADSNIRQNYAMFIAAVARNRLSVQTALITNFYGGKHSMKNRLLSITDTTKKKTGILLICIAFILTVCTSFVLARDDDYYPVNDELDAPILDSPDDITLDSTENASNSDYFSQFEFMNGKISENLYIRWSWSKTNCDGERIVSDDFGKTWQIQEDFKTLELLPEVNYEVYTHTLRQILPDGESITIGFGAYSYDALYEFIKYYLDEQIQIGNMTQEEADDILVEISILN
jgi:beta-lactamase regulating signal transducer with metallopeptidase domain